MTYAYDGNLLTLKKVEAEKYGYLFDAALDFFFFFFYAALNRKTANERDSV